MGILDKPAVTRKKLQMLFVIDVSRSMSYNGKLPALNRAMSSVVNVARELDAENTDVQVEFAALLFGTGENGSGCQWINDEPEPVSRFVWRNVDAWGSTPMGDALHMLNHAMSRDGFFSANATYVSPVVVMVSDGRPWTKHRNERRWAETGLDVLSRNPWFRASTRASIAVGDDVAMDLLEDFAGTPDHVFTVYDADRLKEIIEFIVVTTTMLRTKLKCSKSDGEDAFSDDARRIKSRSPAVKPGVTSWK